MSKETVLAEILGIEQASELLDEAVAELVEALRERGIASISKTIGDRDMARKKELTPTELEMVEQLAQEAAVEAVEDVVDEAVDEAVAEAVDEAIAELAEEDSDERDEEKVDDDLAARVAALEERLTRILQMLEGGEEKSLKPRAVKRASAARETEIELSELLPELKAWGAPRQTLFGRPLRGGVK